MPERFARMRRVEEMYRELITAEEQLDHPNREEALGLVDDFKARVDKAWEWHQKSREERKATASQPVAIDELELPKKLQALGFHATLGGYREVTCPRNDKVRVELKFAASREEQQREAVAQLIDQNQTWIVRRVRGAFAGEPENTVHNIVDRFVQVHSS